MFGIRSIVKWQLKKWILPLNVSVISLAIFPRNFQILFRSEVNTPPQPSASTALYCYSPYWNQPEKNILPILMLKVTVIHMENWFSSELELWILHAYKALR
jgi:hypothetical protein